MNSIPLHQLDKSNTAGLQMRRFAYGQSDDQPSKSYSETHRDSHYMFFVMMAGQSTAMIDFEEVTFNSPSICYILPAQVHRRLNYLSADYWAIAIDTALVPPECRDVFERQQVHQASLICPDTEHSRFIEISRMLYEACMGDEASPFYFPVVNGLLVSFLAMAAKCFDDMAVHYTKQPRLAALNGQFKQLLAAEVRAVKSASAYAAKLNVSETYLNEAIRKTTGYPVSYWIRQEVMMEAKRLLFHTEMNVKEIAHTLGYDDHSYFSRIFRKTVGMPAQLFRQQYRK